MLIQIRNWNTGNLIFELDKENNTIKDTVEEAVKQGVDLSYAELNGANLSGANLTGAKMESFDFYKVNLSGANLEGANLRNSVIQFSDLSNANLKGANLENFLFICNSDLSGADLTGANIRKCVFDSAWLDNTIIPDFPMACPETGSFIGYKKISDTKEYYFKRKFIIKLEIPEDAKRSSSTSNKCRCSKAKVLEIKDIESNEKLSVITNTRNITNIKNADCTYKVGEMVYPDSFDECRWHECSNGIHFFMTEEEAINY